MERFISTRRAYGHRRQNNQNLDVDPAAARARAPQQVRELEYTGDLRTIKIQPRRLHPHPHMPRDKGHAGPVSVKGRRWGGS